MWEWLLSPWEICWYVLDIFFAIEFFIVPVVWYFNPTAAISLAVFILLMSTVYILFNKKDEARMVKGIGKMCSLLIVWGIFLFCFFTDKTQPDTKKVFFSEVYESAQKDISWEKFVNDNKSTLKNEASTSPQEQSSDKDMTAKNVKIYAGKVAGKAGEYLSNTPEATQKRAELQSKLEKVGNFLKKKKNPETEQTDVEK